MTLILPVLTGVSCLISLALMLLDFNRQNKPQSCDVEEKTVVAKKYPCSLWIFSGICIVLTVVIAVFFPVIYSDNSIWVNIKRMLLLSMLWAIAYIDAKSMRIPNLFVIYGLVCRFAIFLFELFLDSRNVWTSLGSEGLAAAGLLLAGLLCGLIIKNGIGFGDMKLFIVMGLLLGLNGIWGAIFLSLIVSFFIAVFSLITRKKTRKDAIPFGPALAIGTYLSVCLSGM